MNDKPELIDITAMDSPDGLKEYTSRNTPASVRCDGYWIGYTYYIINQPDFILPDDRVAVNNE